MALLESLPYFLTCTVFQLIGTNDRTKKVAGFFDESNDPI